ncbi:MAG: type III-B CRISPR-associated protein Cas10/Cmr2 [Chitinophagales bacterium]|nr:type III-B CRISPR-associated protein Cas10/Cmr2 [Chitinophagales bacterium]
MNTTYTAITIGPIYKTMQQAKRTREAWQASYFFSYLMKCIRSEAERKGIIILPEAPKAGANFHGAGIYPDRLIMKSKNAFDVEKEVIEKAVQQLATDLNITAPLLKDYLNIHFVQTTSDALKDFELLDDKGQSIVSYIHKLNYLLNVKELNQSYSSSDAQFFKDLFDEESRKAFYQNAFNSKNYRFPSIQDITVQGKAEEIVRLREKAQGENIDMDDVEIGEKIEKPYKYLAILQADGDNFGKVISAISSDESKVTQFSKDLVNFSEKASKIIHDFGGTIIYIGGDDILAFCPLVNYEKNIFNVVKTLNERFHEIFKDNVYKKYKVSLSYGLSISYYKYPLNEAMTIAHDLLFNKAKKEPLKNCIAFQVLQNSGSLRETILNFEKDKNFDAFLKMFADVKEKDQLLQSLTHQLIEDEPLLRACLKKNRIDGYFDNHYNPEAKKTVVKDFIEAMKSNLKTGYTIYQEANAKLIADGKTPIENIEFKTLQQMNTIAKTINFFK